MNIGKRIYFDKTTGNIVIDTGERAGAVIPTTIDQDFASYTALKERVRSTVDVIQLSYGQYAQDFVECSGYRVNPTTKALEFSYPDPNAPTTEPVYRAPLTEQIELIQQALDELLLGGGL